MSEPIPVSEALARRVEALREEAARRPEPLPADADDGEAMAAWRERQWEAAMPARFRACRLEGLADQAVAAKVRAWAQDPKVNLVLLGPVGVGKTFAAVAACRTAWEAGRGVAFWPVVEVLDALRPGGDEGLLERLCRWPDLLVLDDIGGERPTPWTAERLYALVNRRWLEERPIVATSNLEPDDLPAAVGERTFSRLVGSGAVVLRLGGQDRRRKRAGEAKGA